MSQHIEEFVDEIERSIKDFRDAYITKHKENPNNYPLSLPSDNEGLWLDFFINFYTDGTV